LTRSVRGREGATDPTTSRDDGSGDDGSGDDGSGDDGSGKIAEAPYLTG
jgi:hypothetical protein